MTKEWSYPNNSPKPKNSSKPDSLWKGTVCVWGYHHQCNHEFQDWLRPRGRLCASFEDLFGIAAKEANEKCPFKTDWEGFQRHLLSVASGKPTEHLGLFGEWFQETRIPSEHILPIIQEYLED